MGQAANANSISVRRKVLQAAIDAAIDALDFVDDDPDLEDDDEDDLEDGREPALGWTLAFNQAGRAKYYGGLDDAEKEHDGREPDNDREPSLGSSEPLYHLDDDQLGWGLDAGSRDEREQDGGDMREECYYHGS